MIGAEVGCPEKAKMAAPSGQKSRSDGGPSTTSACAQTFSASHPASDSTYLGLFCGVTRVGEQRTQPRLRGGERTSVKVGAVTPTLLS